MINEEEKVGYTSIPHSPLFPLSLFYEEHITETLRSVLHNLILQKLQQDIHANSEVGAA
jgi:hypothetical protein